MLQAIITLQHLVEEELAARHVHAEQSLVHLDNFVHLGRDRQCASTRPRSSRCSVGQIQSADLIKRIRL